jgi:hypothetical protein
VAPADFLPCWQVLLWALALISGCEAHNFLIMLLIIFDILNMFQIQALIMYKTSRF